MQERDTTLREGRDLATMRPIADGSMILKFMLAGDDNKTAADFPDMRNLPETAIATIVKEAPIALMVKDAKRSKDGWFWGTWYLGTSAKDQQDQIDWPPPPNFPFPSHVQGVCMSVPFFCAEGASYHEWLSPRASQSSR